MNFFDSLINEVVRDLHNLPEKKLAVNNADQLKEHQNSTVLLLRDTAFEMKGVGFNLVTEEDFQNEILLFGKDICEIKENTPFTRICIISLEKCDDEQELYRIIRQLEYVKYKFFPEGYMIRSASDSRSEAVRVSKKAVKNGLSFSDIGSLFIKKYKEIPGVKSVKIIFITDKNGDVKQFKSIGMKSDEITKALDHIMNSVSFDCDSCGLKAICDEVEGMREMHFKNADIQ